MQSKKEILQDILKYFDSMIKASKDREKQLKLRYEQKLSEAQEYNCRHTRSSADLIEADRFYEKGKVVAYESMKDYIKRSYKNEIK